MADIKNKNNKYADIIHLPHPVSKMRRQMPVKDRAAQFAPFSAVVGYDDAVKELVRYTEAKRDLDDMEKEVINRQLNELENMPFEKRNCEITYFQEDGSKEGGMYVKHMAKIKKIDKIKSIIYMEDGIEIHIDDVFKILKIK